MNNEWTKQKSAQPPSRAKADTTRN